MTAGPADLAARARIEAALLARRSRTGRAAVPRLPRSEGDNRFPLSPVQHLMWHLHHDSPTRNTWVTLGGIRLFGALDIGALERAWAALADRHEALRTVFTTEEHGEPAQIVRPSSTGHLSFQVVEVTPEGADDAMGDFFDEPFDLCADPPGRLRVLRVGPEEHHIAIVVHHIVSDGHTMSVLIEELTALYFACSAGLPSPLAPLTLQPADLAAWQGGRLTAARRRQLLDYWRTALDGVLVPVPPSDVAPRPATDCTGRTYQLPVSDRTVTALRQLARKHGATPFMVSLAAFQILLARWTGVRDGAVTTPYSCRDRPEADRLVGAFINLLLVRADLSGDPTYLQVLERVRDRTAADFEHHDLPVAEVIEALGQEPAAGRRDLLRALFTEESNPAVPDEAEEVLRSEMVMDPPWRQAERDFTLRVTHDATAGTHVVVTYRTNRYTAARVRDIAADYRDLLDRIAADPSFRVFDERGGPPLRVPSLPPAVGGA
ncbi:condensation domain-containing protein [Streptomyces sp. NPDC091416]|uniref:condensation domain-containing protein n=1 Tax=Streptomyces sp. NPDC091416 TaxID=3366003 RepID=UPI003830BF04